MKRGPGTVPVLPLDWVLQLVVPSHWAEVELWRGRAVAIARELADSPDDKRWADVRGCVKAAQMALTLARQAAVEACK